MERLYSAAPGGSPPDKPGSGNDSSSSVSYSAANSITSAGTYSSKTYKSTTADQNSVLVTASGTVKLVSPTVTKSGDSDGGDNCNFYGINSAVMAMGGGTTSIKGGTVTATAKGANGVFSYGGNGGTNGAAGDGTTVIISGTTIKTTGDNGGGIMTTGGGVMKASNLTITTTGNSSAPIRTDRGGGSVTVSGGSYTSSGVGSPAIYSTADIVVSDATLTSYHSEGVCIEGQNSVALTNCTLSATNDSINGNATFSDAIMIYQSQSGDAASGTSTFSMTGGTLNNYKGHVFHVTNTSAVISLNGVTINDSGDGVILSVCDDGWSGASNIATLNASAQTLEGDILVGDDSTLTLNLTDSTTFTGNISGSITNAKGTTVSSDVGTVNVSLDSSSKWYLTGDTYISDFEGTAANVITGSYKLYENGTEVTGTTENDEDNPLNFTNSTKNTLITGTALADTIDNTGSRVTIDGAAGTDSINNSGARASIFGGADADNLINSGKYVTIEGGTGKDYITNTGSRVSILGGTNNDSITNSGKYVTIDGGSGNDTISGSSNNDSIYGGAGNDSIVGNAGNDKLYGDAGNDKLIGNAGNDSISGGKGNDSILGGSGNDSITGDAGNDKLIGNAGNDTINGGKGNDSILGGSGNDSITGDAGNDKLSGNAGNDTINGGSGKDTISGGTGNDSILGGAGNDSIAGNSGADTLSGGSGNDSILGGAGNDSLAGGTGNDSLWGGSGKDIFYYASGDGKDIIYGFDNKDTLTLDNLDFTTSYSASKGKIVFKVDGGSVTLFDFTATTFHVNDKTYTMISGKKLVEQS